MKRAFRVISRKPPGSVRDGWQAHRRSRSEGKANLSESSMSLRLKRFEFPDPALDAGLKPGE